MTRILVVTNLYPPEALGGYEWSCHDVMRRLATRGHDIEVLTTATRFAGTPAGEVASFPVRRELEWYWDDHVLTSPPVLERYAIERRNLARLRAAVARHRPQVASVWNLGAMSHALPRALAAAGVPIVYAVCDEWPVYGPHLDAWGRIFLRRGRLAAVAQRVLRVPCAPTDLGPTGAWCFVSEHTRSACRDGSPYTFPRSTIVHSGIEPADFPIAPPPDDRATLFGWQLLHVGRLDERKGVLTAVDAMAHLPADARLSFVGRGDADRAIVERATALGVADRVSITSADRTEVARHYRTADVLLFTSEWAEPFGLTPIEAMACGTPVVGTGTGGSAGFLVDEVTCLRYPPGDAAALARAVERLASDPQLRARLRTAGSEVAAELTTDRLADVFEEWHVAAADGFPDGSPPDRALLADRPTAR